MATYTAQGQSFSSADVKVTIENIPLDVKDLSYESSRDIESHYSQGQRTPTSWSEGKETYTGSITLYTHVGQILENTIGAGKSVLDITPFTITVSYLNQAQRAVTDVIVAKFRSAGRSSSEGEMGLSFQHDLHVISVKYNATA